jgi:hypothetical protein
MSLVNQFASSAAGDIDAASNRAAVTKRMKDSPGDWWFCKASPSAHSNATELRLAITAALPWKQF